MQLPRDGLHAMSAGMATDGAARAASRPPDAFETKPPELTPEAAERIAAEWFGIAATSFTRRSLRSSSATRSRTGWSRRSLRPWDVYDRVRPVATTRLLGEIA
jgi:hypothetical protein